MRWVDGMGLAGFAAVLGIVALGCSPARAQQAAGDQDTLWYRPVATWKGEGYQAGYGSWTIEIEFAADGSARIDYPSIPCGGTLTPRDLTPAGGRFSEHIRRHAGKCTNNGTVILELADDGALRYTYQLAANTYHGSLELDPATLTQERRPTADASRTPGTAQPGAAARTAEQAAGPTMQIEGIYAVQGTNPDGSRYTGTCKVTKVGENRYRFEWSVGNSYKGEGTLEGDILTVDWGSDAPVIYKVKPGGRLEGTWARGRATEVLAMKARPAVPPDLGAEQKSAETAQTVEPVGDTSTGALAAGNSTAEPECSDGSAQCMLSVARRSLPTDHAGQFPITVYETFLNLAAAEFLVGDRKHADTLHEQATHILAKLPPGEQQVGYPLFVDLYQSIGLLDRAVSTAELLEHPLERAASLSKIARTAMAANKMDKAKVIFLTTVNLILGQKLEMLFDPESEIDEYDADTIAAVAGDLHFSGFTNDAQKLLDDMLEAIHGDSALASYVVGFAAIGRPELAIKVVKDKIQSREAKAVSMINIARQLALDGNYALALKFVRQNVSAAETMNADSGASRFLYRATAVYAISGEEEEVEKVLAGIPDKFWRRLALIEVAVNDLRNGNMEAAVARLDGVERRDRAILDAIFRLLDRTNVADLKYLRPIVDSIGDPYAKVQAASLIAVKLAATKR